MDTNIIDCRCFCSACEGRTKETYKLKAICSNCGWNGIAILRKGDTFPWSKECPNCGTMHLQAGKAPEFYNSDELARILDEAAERGATWLLDQTSNIDPAIAATNSGKWLIRLREKQTATLRAAIKGEI